MQGFFIASKIEYTMIKILMIFDNSFLNAICYPV